MPLASINGVQLHFIVLDPVSPARSNADVVLVHGFGASLGFWYWLAPALAASNRVLIFDLRGHGLSSMPSAGYTTQVMAADLEALVDFLGVPEAHFLGHSFGGRIIIHFASKNPERIKSIVLVDVLLKSVGPKAVGSDEEPAVALEALARFRLRGPFSGIAGRLSALQVLRLLNKTTAPDEISRSSDPPAERLAQLNKPTLLVYGERSGALPTASALAQLWPHARTDIIPGVDHLFPIVYPERFLSTVSSFLKFQSYRHVRSDLSEGGVGDGL